MAGTRTAVVAAAEDESGGTEDAEDVEGVSIAEEREVEKLVDVVEDRERGETVEVVV